MDLRLVLHLVSLLPKYWVKLTVLYWVFESVALLDYTLAAHYSHHLMSAVKMAFVMLWEKCSVVPSVKQFEQCLWERESEISSVQQLVIPMEQQLEQKLVDL